MVESDPIALIVAIIGAFSAAGGLIFTGLSYRANTNARYLEVLRNFDNEISTIETSQERNDNYDLFAGRYLNVHERLAFLSVNSKIPKDLARYYDSSFSSALGILQIEKYRHYRQEVTNLVKWCGDNNIRPGEAPQPHPEVKR